MTLLSPLEVSNLDVLVGHEMQAFSTESEVDDAAHVVCLLDRHNKNRYLSPKGLDKHDVSLGLCYAELSQSGFEKDLTFPGLLSVR